VAVRDGFDLCVIGGGAGGLAVAVGAARMGARVALVEARRLGGDCLWTGCVPSKALLAAAARVHAARTGGRFGLRARVDVDFAAVMAHVRAAIRAVEPRDSEARMRRLGIEVIRARARFADPDTVDADGMRIRARRFVIATGSRPARPDLPGLDCVPHLTSDDVFTLDHLPERLLVLGGGPVGVEMAQAFARLGSRVDLLQRRRILPREAEELVRPLAAALREEGVGLHEQVQVVGVEEGPRLLLQRDGQRYALAGSHLLVATGRRPDLDGLEADRAGIAVAEGAVWTDARLRTTNPKVYALGDVRGGELYTHAAALQAGVVLKNALLGIPARYDPARVPHTVYTDPELFAVGPVGEVEEELRRIRLALTESDRALAEGRERGFLELAVDRGRRLRAIRAVGPRAVEYGAQLLPALGRRDVLVAIARTTMPYPSFAGLPQRAAAAVFEDLVFGPWMRSWVRMRRWWR